MIFTVEYIIITVNFEEIMRLNLYSNKILQSTEYVCHYHFLM